MGPIDTIGVIGGAGHVGLPTGLVFADTGHSVILIDKDEERLKSISEGDFPFREEGGEGLLENVLEEGRLNTSTDLGRASECDAIIIVVGTPIDEHHNPQMDNLMGLVDELTDFLGESQLLVLRSTVYPGITDEVCRSLERAGFTVGEDIHVSFAPERVAQHDALAEIVELPQLIGAPDDRSFERTKELFETIIESECLRLSPKEAELGKLYTNMWRYLTFAAANEFYLIAESFNSDQDVNVNEILDKTGYNYPRFDVPSPGANVGGPCLTKDGWFLVDNIPYNELVSAAFQINEGMPSQIIDKMSRKKPDPEKVALLGMTFKGNSDDVRNSVAFKMEKQLKLKGYHDIVKVEPNLDDFADVEDVKGSDWVILMTPHSEFGDLEKIVSLVDEGCLFSDVWGYWDEVKYASDNGYFFAKEV